jgi:hypothetical protein
MNARAGSIVAIAACWLGCESLAPMATQMAGQYAAALQAPPPLPPAPTYAGGYAPPPGGYTTQPYGAPPPPPPPMPPGYGTAPEVPLQTVNPNTEQGCFDAVQGRVPWNRAGSTAWNPDNVRRLCAGVTDTQARIACFSSVVQSADNWSLGIDSCAGGGTSGASPELSCFNAVQGRVAWNRAGATSWNSVNVQRLCAGVASDAEANTRISCFSSEIRSHDNWSRAITSCTGGAATPLVTTAIFHPAATLWAGGGGHEQGCFDAVQGRVAWNRAGATSWNPTNVKRLCAGVTSSQQAQARISCFSSQIAAHDQWGPALDACVAASPSSGLNTERGCFDAVQGKVAWNRAGATGWNPVNVQRLCAGVTDTPGRIHCFSSQIAAHDDWGRAIDACATAFRSAPEYVTRSADAYSVLGRSGEKKRFDCAEVGDEYEELMFGDVLANPGDFVSTVGGQITRGQFDQGRQAGLRLSDERAGLGVGLLKTSKGAPAKFLFRFTDTEGDDPRLEIVDATIYAGDTVGDSTRLGRISLVPGSGVDLDPGGDGAAVSEAEAFDVGFRVGDSGELVVESLGAAAVEFPIESLCGETAASGEAAPAS